MHLQRVERNATTACRLICKRCQMLGKDFWHPEIATYADLEDAPGTFYCEDCAEAVAPNQTDGIYTLATTY